MTLRISRGEPLCHEKCEESAPVGATSSTDSHDSQPGAGDASSVGASYDVGRRTAIAAGIVTLAAAAEAFSPGLPSHAQADPPPLIAPPNTAVFYPENYGAEGDGVTDDTDAIQACIDALQLAKGGTIQFGPNTYLVNGGSDGGPNHLAHGNSMLCLPYSTSVDEQFELQLRGVEGSTVVETNFTGASYSASFGCPSLIGGPTPEQAKLGFPTDEPAARNTFSMWTVTMADLEIVLPSNPELCGIDLSRHRRATIERVFVRAELTSNAPSRVYSFGVRMPQGLNFGQVVVDHLTVSGFFAGVVVSSAHLKVLHLRTTNCFVGLAMDRSDLLPSYENEPFSASVGMLNTESCLFHIGGWSPAGFTVVGTFYLVLQVWNIQDRLPSSTPSWGSTILHLADGDNKLYGRLNYVWVNSAATAGNDLTATVIGGNNLSLKNIANAVDMA
ncbi:MAG: hypothetical protein IPK93_04600 [Solirubrobacterales bacterium]|nr:hypothetical protein [Solirubrobacterales bacterium]